MGLSYTMEAKRDTVVEHASWAPQFIKACMGQACKGGHGCSTCHKTCVVVNSLVTHAQHGDSSGFMAFISTGKEEKERFNQATKIS